ncbi:MAG TPA: gephyrin-like molybdotransferase Glp, partial [Dongiaceae bacterium]|nr:gephyrin-like molybdotransferase Glp [Dongiaceae bacterium]
MALNGGKKAGPGMTPLHEAKRHVQAQFVAAVGVETVPLAAARNRVLATNLVAAVDLPPHDSAAVDGFAVRSADLWATNAPRLRLVGRTAAGHPFNGTVGGGQTVHILTGAPLPQGADAIVMQEACSIRGDAVDFTERVRPGANFRRRGEDVRTGSVVLAAGRRLRPQDIALAAALGVHELIVFERLRVALFSTGDEVREPGTPLNAGEIWDANRWLLRSLLEALGCKVSDLGILNDDLHGIEGAISGAAHEHDLIVTSGGVSVGSEDHMTNVIRRRGSLDTRRLAIKPGRPVGLGDIDDCPILALPGNPVAAAVSFIAFGRSVVLRLAGSTEDGPLAFRLPAGFGYRKIRGRRDYLLGVIERDGSGISSISMFEKQGAAMLSAITQTDGFVAIDEHIEHVQP